MGVSDFSDTESTVSALPAEVEAVPVREPGGLRRFPEWRDFEYDPSVFAPASGDELKDEGWIG